MYDFTKLVPLTAAILDLYLLEPWIGKLTYNGLAKMLGLTEVRHDNWHLHPLCQVFKVLDSEDKKHGRPLRTVIVVRSDTGRPGDGFYCSLFDIKRIGVLSESEKSHAYKRELGRAAAYVKASRQVANSA